MRRRFFGLLGVSAVPLLAQRWKVCEPTLPDSHICSDKYKPALNNQCPVCGEMVEPYKINKPNQRIVRCTRCSAAFWQDAE